MTDGKARPEVATIKQATWIRVAPVVNTDLIRLLSAEIDRGEAEAITLALEDQPALILLAMRMPERRRAYTALRSPAS